VKCNIAQHDSFVLKTGSVLFFVFFDCGCHTEVVKNFCMKKTSKVVMKINDGNENHHLWNNRGIWWCHVTIHKSDATSERMRFSLKTKDVEKARERRDRIFKKIAEVYDIAA
jgi:hypothetical protein